MLAITPASVSPSAGQTASALRKNPFAARWLACTIPYRRFAPGLAADNARLGADVDRYSFIAVDFHHLLLAGLPAHLTLIFALTTRLLIKTRLVREGAAGWAAVTQHNGVGLTGKTLGSLGMGNIGAELFRLAKPLHMAFLAHDPYAPAGIAAELGVEMTALDDLFRRSDILCINCPLTSETRHLVNAHRISLMKPTAYLINTARGGVVDQRALVAALTSGRIAGAGLDVFEQEPPRSDRSHLQARERRADAPCPLLVR